MQYFRFIYICIDKFGQIFQHQRISYTASASDKSDSDSDSPAGHHPSHTSSPPVSKRLEDPRDRSCTPMSNGSAANSEEPKIVVKVCR